MDFEKLIQSAEQELVTASRKEDESTQQEDQTREAGESQHEEERTFTQKEVNDIVQKRLAKERERLSKVFQEEKQLSELEEREQNILKRELRADMIDELRKRGLPSRLADLLDYSSPENLEQSMDEVTTIFSSALGEKIRPYARQATPVDGTSHRAAPKSDADIRKAFSI